MTNTQDITEKDVTSADIAKAATKPPHISPLDCARTRVMIERTSDLICPKCGKGKAIDHHQVSYIHGRTLTYETFYYTCEEI